jgi:hypothetical protein
MTTVHDKQAETISISIPGYIDKALIRFHEWTETKHAHSPDVYKTLEYGARVQYAADDATTPLNKADIKMLQEVVGSFLYYARAVDPTMLTTINTIASEQATTTEAVRAHAVHLPQYAAVHRDHVVTFKKSKMHVIIQAGASYLSRSQARSVAGVITHVGDADNPTVRNGMIHATSSIIDVIVAFAGEAEYGAAFIAAQQGVWIRNITIAMSHAQPSIPLLCDKRHLGLNQSLSRSLSLSYPEDREPVSLGVM